MTSRRGSGRRRNSPPAGQGRSKGSSGNNATGPADSGRSGQSSQSQSRQNKSQRSRSRQSRRGLGGDQVEGRQAVRELLLAGTRRVREVYLINEMDSAGIIDDIVELAQESNVVLRPVSRRHFESEALTESHQGVLARAEPVKEHDLDTLAARPDAFLLVLDGITDPGNLGAILRTAECAGVTGVVLPKHRSVHLSPTVTKTAAGAIEHLPMAVVGGVPSALIRLSDAGVTVVGLEAGGTDTIFDIQLGADDPVALVLGAEGVGLGRLVRERCDTLAAIPLAGQLHSLNVAMASAVGCFEIVRRRTEATEI